MFLYIEIAWNRSAATSTAWQAFLPAGLSLTFAIWPAACLFHRTVRTINKDQHPLRSCRSVLCLVLGLRETSAFSRSSCTLMDHPHPILSYPIPSHSAPHLLLPHEMP